MKGLLLSVAINLLVGAYFLWGYPRTVRRSFRDGPPPAFALLARVIPPLGALLIVASLAWLIHALYSTQ